MFDKVTEIISRYTDVNVSEMSESTNLLSDLRLESMDFIDIVCDFEEEFDCEIPERDFRKLVTIKNIISYFQPKQAEEIKARSEESEEPAVGYTPSNCKVFPLTRALAEKVPELVNAVYGAGYPAQYLYSPEKFWEKTVKGGIYPYVAINADGKAAGMISLIRLRVNFNAFELGQLMVTPEYRGTDVAELLISCISAQELDFGVIYSESVTGHKFSQRSCLAGGFCDTALKLNIMPSFEPDDGRVSCVVSCIERGEKELEVYLPQAYAEAVKFSLNGLKPRTYRTSTDNTLGGATMYQINDEELFTSQYVNVTVSKIGADFTAAFQRLEDYAVENGVKALIINTPLASPGNNEAVDWLRSKGFLYGGVMPRWLPESDTILMQKLYGNAPEWDKIKLFSEKIKEIAETVKGCLVART
ncbi:MAG: phosphopantetheine-binding protein [Oscillospiraceae bacterium]|nr:phosphopantetheine-binding protein [Oscillospiraceae bacterium]